jgi:hypothetical protein
MKPEQKGYRACFQSPNLKARFNISPKIPNRKAAHGQPLSSAICNLSFRAHLHSKQIQHKQCIINKLSRNRLPNQCIRRKSVPFSATLYID